MRVRAMQGDTVSAICWRYFGRTQGLVEATLAANPGLADSARSCPTATSSNYPTNPHRPRKRRATVGLTMTEPVTTNATVATAGVAVLSLFPGVDAAVVMGAFAGAGVFVLASDDLAPLKRLAFFLISFVAGCLSRAWLPT
ncbi:Phage Tail Protein X [Pandoraea pnomenusa]|uniref:Phage Tail Protein X n=2 Tax=Pandoraea pnomenusa TaxID=93220 RepID=A0A379KDD4_9BURK|nr:Phage Tail Protein X [Pandoraea pnomenusa]